MNSSNDNGSLAYDNVTNYFLWSEDVYSLRKLVAEILDDDLIAVSVVNEDKHHKMHSFKTSDCTVKLYSTTKKIVIQGSGSEDLSKALSAYMEEKISDVNAVVRVEEDTSSSDDAIQANRADVDEGQLDQSSISASETNDLAASQGNDIEIPYNCECAKLKEALTNIQKEIKKIKHDICSISINNDSSQTKNLNNKLHTENNGLRNQVKDLQLIIEELRNNNAILGQEKASLVTCLRIMHESPVLSPQVENCVAAKPSNAKPETIDLESDSPQDRPVVHGNKNQQKQGNKTKNKKNKNKSTQNSQTKADNSQMTNNQAKKRSVAILGDSILKGLKWWQMSRDDTQVSLKHFPGSTVTDMESYVLPTLRNDPDEVILHIGTNDLQHHTPNQVAESIVNLADNVCQNSSAQVTVSSLVQRTDDPSLVNKVTETNKILKRFTTNRAWGYVDNSRIGNSMLNKSGLHLNEAGASALAKNMMRHIYNHN